MASSFQQRALFVQPFGLAASGGGARILASMLRGQPFAARSLNTQHYAGPALDWIDEKHLPLRPPLGRFDRTRFASLAHWMEIPMRPLFERRLAREMARWDPDVVHVVPHWPWDFHIAWRLARAAGRRVVMSVHDDLAYTLPARHPYRAEALEMLARMWTEVDHAFAISPELGEEYNARYGRRSFDLITDGLEKIAPRPAPLVPGRFTVYFMGLFHYSYGENLLALTRALARLRAEQPSLDLRLVLRCDRLAPGLDAAFPIRLLPFADQATVLRDMEEADLLYFPLPFGADHAAFTRFSLSTKMVSYLGSGRPIFYHGPRDSAAAHLLEKHAAAFACYSPDDAEIAALLLSARSAPARDTVVENALALARADFPIETLRRRFRQGLFP